MSKKTVTFDINIGGNGVVNIDKLNVSAQKAASGFDKLLKKVTEYGNAVFAARQLMGTFSKISGEIEKCTKAYEIQNVAETKLAKMMRNSMNAADAEIQSVKELASAQQKLGVIGDEVQLAGAQELATYLKKSESLKKILPVLNDMLAQQYGLNASQEQAVIIAQMMGKVLDGQTGALSRYGYSFTQAQEEVLKFGTEEQKVSTLTKLLSSYVGGMNAELAKTPEGKLKQMANDAGDMQERFGSLIVNIRQALLPVRETVLALIDSIATWFEQNREQIVETVSSVVNSIVGIINSVAGFFKRNIATILAFSKVLISVGVGITAYSVAAKACAIATALWRSRIVALEFVMIAKRFGLAAATRLMWGLNASMLANPVLLLVAGVAAAVTVFKLFASKTNETAEAMKKAKKAHDEFYANEKMNLDIIFAKLKQTNPQSAERNRLVNELKEMYPDLNEQLERELRNTNSLAGAYDEAHVCICFVTYKCYKELERILKNNGIKLSVDKLLELNCSKAMKSLLKQCY